jgi:hypothetical protein
MSDLVVWVTIVRIKIWDRLWDVGVLRQRLIQKHVISFSRESCQGGLDGRGVVDIRMVKMELM